MSGSQRVVFNIELGMTLWILQFVMHLLNLANGIKAIFIPIQQLQMVSFSPEELADCYREKGYDFIAITDHSFGSRYKFRNKTYWHTGVEFDFHDILTGKYFHMVSLEFRG